METRIGGRRTPLLKPENHATRAMRDRLFASQAHPEPAPYVPEGLVQWLEATFPPRCYEPNQEKLEDHLLYAGRVSLIASMRGTVEAQKVKGGALAALADDADPFAEQLIVYSKENP